jgi:hypothetical protein
LVFLLIAPEDNALFHLVVKLFPGHIGFLPPICRNVPFIRLSSVIDDVINRLGFVWNTPANHILAPAERMSFPLWAIPLPGGSPLLTLKISQSRGSGKRKEGGFAVDYTGPFCFIVLASRSPGIV